MKKIILFFAIMLALFLIPNVRADGYTVNVTFWTDTGMTTHYYNSFLYVYLQNSICNAYGLNCTYECRHSDYPFGTATIENVTGGKVWQFWILQGGSFDNETSCPRVIPNPQIWSQFDEKLISSDLNLNYYINTSSLVKSKPPVIDFYLYANVIFWIVALIIVLYAGKLSGSGWVALIAFVVMVIIKLLLATAGIL